MKKTKLTLAMLIALLAMPINNINAEDLDSLKENHKEAENKLNEKETELKQIEGRILTTEEKLKKIANEIANTKSKIVSKQKEIDATKEKIKKLEKEIEETTKELEYKKEVLAKNLRKLHMKGDVTMMEYLFRTESVSDFFDRVDLMKRIADANEQLYDEVRKLKEELELQKEKMVKEKEKQEKAKAVLVSLRDEQVKNEKNEMSLLQALVNDHKHVEEEMKVQEDAMATIAAQISKEMERRTAERKKKEQTGTFTEPKGTGLFSIPISGQYVISSHYGYRIHPIFGTSHLHNGTDFAANYGTPILAADSGTVLYSGPAQGYGNWVVIDHNNGFYTTYGHMPNSSIIVSPGMQVSRGQKIAEVGSEGNSTGPHLHFVVSKDSLYNYVNPMNYLR